MNVPHSYVIHTLPVLFSSKTYDVNVIQNKVLRKHMGQACMMQQEGVQRL